MEITDQNPTKKMVLQRRDCGGSEQEGEKKKNDDNILRGSGTRIRKYNTSSEGRQSSSLLIHVPGSWRG